MFSLTVRPPTIANTTNSSHPCCDTAPRSKSSIQQKKKGIKPLFAEYTCHAYPVVARYSASSINLEHTNTPHSATTKYPSEQDRDARPRISPHISSPQSIWTTFRHDYDVRDIVVFNNIRLREDSEMKAQDDQRVLLDERVKRMSGMKSRRSRLLRFHIDNR